MFSWAATKGARRPRLGPLLARATCPVLGAAAPLPPVRSPHGTRKGGETWAGPLSL